jgi:hypothetical protein
MYTNQLNKMGKKYVKHFIGVFPWDRLPKHITPISRLIVNTDSHNLGGQHWIALSYEKGGIVLAFDPFGWYYPPLLVNRIHVNPSIRRVMFNRTMYQSPSEKTCGLYCIRFLSSINKDTTLCNAHANAAKIF